MGEGLLGNEKAQQGRRDRIRHQRRLLEDAKRAVANSPEGRLVLRWVLTELCDHLACSFSVDAHRTAFREGRRSVAVDLLAELERVAPGVYAVMMAEAARESADDRLNQQAAAEAVAREE